MEKFRMVIEENVAIELSKKGHNLIAQLPSENYTDRRVYVFANTNALETDIKEYDKSTYYK